MKNNLIKIVSYNIHKGFNVNHRDFVLPQMRDALHNIDSDLLFLQEVQGRHKKRNLKKIEKHIGEKNGTKTESTLSTDVIKTFGKNLGKSIEKSINKSIEKNITPELIKKFEKNLGPQLVKKLEKKLESISDSQSSEESEKTEESALEEKDLLTPKEITAIQEIPQTNYLAEENWPNFIYGKNAVYGPAHHGNALLSKFPFSVWDNINVSLSKRASRSLLHAVVELPDRQLHVICIHLGLFKAERTIQLTVLSDRIREHIPDDAPLIIAGDFNDWQGKAENHLETELALKEVYKVLHGEHAKTFPAVRPAFRVDRIYYRGLHLRKAQVLDGLPWKKLSDHLPLYAELVLI